MKKLLAFLALNALTPAPAAPLDDLPRIGGFIAGTQAWTFNQGTVFEALERTQAAGGKVIEVFLMGQKLSPELGDVALDENLSDEHLALLQKKCAETGVRIVNAYIGSKQWTRIEQNEAELRRFFEFGKKLGIAGFTGEPAERQWDLVEKLVKEFDLSFAVHNHIKGFEAPYIGGEYRYWDPAYTFEKLRGRDPRFGICLDTGHVARSGLDPLAVLRKIEGRCLSVHLKDVVAADPDGHDCVYGTGIVDVRGVLAELRRQKLRGHIAVEYEWFRSPTFAQDIARCLEFIRVEGEKLDAAAR
jgi:L-ribulose-5-phosphate 3-epimerase